MEVGGGGLVVSDRGKRGDYRKSTANEKGS